MKVGPEQLKQQLKKNLQPIYITHGDEPLLVQECCDTIRSHCREQGFSEREVLNVEAGFDWQNLLASASAMSLFSDRKLIELRLPTGKPGDAGGKTLVEYAGIAPADNVLLIICGKLEGSSTRTKWYKSIEAAGAAVQIWPVDARQLPQWLEQRLAQLKLSASPDALQMLAERVEGNLLAAVQEIEKLRLYAEGDTVDVDTITATVANNARYDVFGLVDRALQGDAGGSYKMLQGLKAEGTEAPIVLWALSREIRTLAQCAEQLEQGNGIERVLQNQRIWDRRKPITKAALKRIRAKNFRKMLQLATLIDQSIKGMNKLNSWDLLAQLTLGLAGKPIGLPIE